MKCSARDMARFGLLVLAKGHWAGEVVASESYLAMATASSQTLNPSYGDLFWLNGKSSHRLPKRAEKPGAIVPAAPADMGPWSSFRPPRKKQRPNSSPCALSPCALSPCALSPSDDATHLRLR